MSGRDVNVYSSKPFFSVRWDFSHGGKGGGVCGMNGFKIIYFFSLTENPIEST